MTRVCVVGAGAWGTTIANLAAVRASVTLWVHGEDTPGRCEKPERIRSTTLACRAGNVD